MSDTQDGNATPKPQQSPLIVNGQYLKDLSFEAPNSPDILSDMHNHQPEINVNVNVTTAKIEGTPANNLHEVVLELHAELKLNGKVGFIAELKYGGVFTVNVPEEHVRPFTLIECPRILFPFAREILANATQNGGFMPLMLQPIDFAAMYQAGLQQQEAGKMN